MSTAFNSELSRRGRRIDGFSMLEMLGALGILGVLLSLGVGYIRSDGLALQGATSSLSASIRSVRLEAVRRNQNVGIRFEVDGNRYQVYLDNDADRQFSKDDVVTQTLVISDNFRGVKLKKISVNSSSATSFNLVFDARGIARSGTVGQLMLGAGSSQKVLTVNAQGKTVTP